MPSSHLPTEVWAWD